MAPLCSFNDGKDVTVHGATCLRPKAAGHLLTALALPQVTLGHVVVEADGKVMQKQQVIGLVFLQPPQQGCLVLLRPLRLSRLSTGSVASLRTEYGYIPAHSRL